MSKCKFCSKKVDKPFQAGIYKFCQLDCAYKFARARQDKQRKRQQAKAKQSQAKEDKADKKALREFKRNDRKHQFQLTKSKIQHWVNHIRDFGLGCISCGTEKPTIQYCGGHYKTAGGHSEMALITKNIHKQCNQYCNMNLSGNIHGTKTTKGYIVGLVDRYGQDYVDWLDSHHELPRYDCDQLIKIRAFYSKLIRDNNPDDSERPF